MRTFNAVVDAGSFVGATDALQIFKAAVSRYVRGPGDATRRALAAPDHTAVVADRRGDVFYARSKELLAGVEEAEAELSSRSVAARGLLRVNAGHLRYSQSGAVGGAFRALHPQVDLDVTLSTIVSSTWSKKADLTIRIATLASSTLISRKLASTSRDAVRLACTL